MLWSYFLHFLKNKRRHGVHSPFAYAYADHVLHQYPLWNFSFSRSEREKTARSLTEQTLLYLCGELAPKINVVKEQILSSARVEIIAEAFPDTIAHHTLYLFPLPHEAGHKALWNRCIAQNQFRFVMDTWYLGIVTNHSAFKNPEIHLLK